MSDPCRFETVLTAAPIGPDDLDELVSGRDGLEVAVSPRGEEGIEPSVLMEGGPGVLEGGGRVANVMWGWGG